MTDSNPYGPANALKLIATGLALYAVGVALYVNLDKEGTLAYVAAGAYVLGSALAGGGVGMLLSFGRDMAMVRVLCALLGCAAGSIFGVTAIDLRVNPIEVAAPTTRPPSAEDLALRARMEALATAKVVRPSAIVTVEATPAFGVEARIRAAAAPYLCRGECPDGVLLEAPAFIDADGDRLQLWLRRLTPAERSALDAALQAAQAPSSGAPR